MGVRLLDVPEDDQRGVPALNVARAPMLGDACGQIKPQKAQYGADGEARRTEHRRGEGGRMSLAPANALKHAKRLKRKMAGNEIETQKGTDPWQRVKKRGREICQSRCDLRTNASVRHVKRMIRLAEGVCKHINI